MRTVLCITLCLMTHAAAFAQGLIRFENSGSGLNAPVTNGMTGLRASGTSFVVQLYGGPASELEQNLTPLGGTTTFFSGGLAGYFTGGTVTNNFVLPGSAGTFQVRAWSSGFDSYEEALAAASGDPNVCVGKSLLFQNGTGINSGEVLSGLKSFTITPVPEPGAVGLLLLAGAALFTLRQKRR